VQDVVTRNAKGRHHTTNSGIDEKCIVISLKEIYVIMFVACNRLPQVRFQWRALMNTVLNLQLT
jgi:hypothetical protein